MPKANWNITGEAVEVVNRFNQCFKVGDFVTVRDHEEQLHRVKIVTKANVSLEPEELEEPVFVASESGIEDEWDCRQVIGAAPSDEQLNDALYREHAHRNPNREAKAKLRELRQETYRLAKWIKANVPAGRHQAVAQTKLDEARMWAANALTLDGEIFEDISQSGPTA
jgi:hypothetical protein